MWIGRRVLNNDKVRYTLALSPVVVLVLMYLLKVWQLHASGVSTSQVWEFGLCRRVDDVSFWSVLALSFACFIAQWSTSSSKRAPQVTMTWGVFITWLISCCLGITAYLLIVCKLNPGTFCSPATGTIGLIQHLEGVLMLYAVVLGHFFLLLVLVGQLRLRGVKSADSRSYRVKGVAGIYVFFLAIFLTMSGLLGLMTSFCTGCKGWPSYGPSKWDIFKYIVAIWWPLLVLAPFALWNLQYLREPGPG